MILFQNLGKVLNLTPCKGIERFASVGFSNGFRGLILKTYVLLFCNLYNSYFMPKSGRSTHFCNIQFFLCLDILQISGALYEHLGALNVFCSKWNNNFKMES